MKHIMAFAVINFFFLISMLSLSGKSLNLKNYKIYLVYILSLVLLILNFEFSIPSMRVVLNVILYIFLARLLFMDNFKESVLLGMSVTIIGILSEVVYGFIAYPILNQTMFVDEELVAALINNFFIGVILFLFCQYTPLKNSYKYLLNITNKIDDRQIIVFSLFIIIVFNFICWISYFVFKSLLSHYYLIFISSSLSLFGAILVFFYFKINNKYLTVYDKYNISLESIKEFEIMIENYRINTHENRNQFKTIRNMCKNKKVSSYIDALLGEQVNDDERLLMEVQKIPAGGLRGIIYTKLLVMKDKKIPFELVVDKNVTSALTDKIDDYTLTDVCRILGVLLDNSIEEVLSLVDKNIMVEVYDDESDIVIAITNNYEGYVDIEAINNPSVSSKGENRGYGLSLVKKLVKKNKKIQHTSEFFEDNFMQKIRIKSVE